jgi:proteasome accessory factor C
MPKATASARARRLLAVLHLFAPGTSIPLTSIAESVGATPAEITEDLELLACCGVAPYSPDELLPIYIESGSVFVWGELPALDRAVRLSAAEAHALVTALAAAGMPKHDPLVSKLLEASAAADGIGEQMASLVRASVNPEGGDLIKALTLALEQRRVVRIAYHGLGRDAAVPRRVEPMSLVHERGTWYLEAFCREAGALRTFRTDRIRSLEATEETFDLRPLSTSGTAFVTDGLPVARISLAQGQEFSSRDWPGGRMVESRPDGTMTVEVPYAGTGWLARQVLARLGEAEVLEPAEMRHAVSALAEAEFAALRG